MATIHVGVNHARWDSGLDQMGTSVSAWSRTASLAAAAVAAAFGRAMGQGISMAADLDDQLRTTQNLTGFSKIAFEELGDAVDDLSSSLGFDADMLALASERVHTLGVAVGDIDDRLLLASKVATAYGGDVGELAFSITQLANEFDTSAESIVAWGQAGGRIASRDLTALLQSMPDLISLAQTANLQFSDLIVTFGGMTRGAGSPQKAVTQLNALLAELVNTTKKGGQAVEQVFGKSFSDLAAEGKTLGEIIDGLLGRFGTAGVQGLFLSNIEALKGFGLLNNNLNLINSTLASSQRELMAEFEQAYANKAESFKTLTRRIRESANSLKRSLVDIQPGSPLYEALERLITILNDEKMATAMQDLAGALISSLTVFSALTSGLVKLGTANVPGTNLSSLDLLLAGSIVSRGRAVGNRVSGFGASSGGASSASRGLAAGFAANTLRSGARLAGAATGYGAIAFGADFVLEQLTGFSVLDEGLKAAGKGLKSLFEDDPGELAKSVKDVTEPVVRTIKELEKEAKKVRENYAQRGVGGNQDDSSWQARQQALIDATQRGQIEAERGLLTAKIRDELPDSVSLIGKSVEDAVDLLARNVNEETFNSIISSIGGSVSEDFADYQMELGKMFANYFGGGGQVGEDVIPPTQEALDALHQSALDAVATRSAEQIAREYQSIYNQATVELHQQGMFDRLDELIRVEKEAARVDGYNLEELKEMKELTEDLVGNTAPAQERASSTTAFIYSPFGRS